MLSEPGAGPRVHDELNGVLLLIERDDADASTVEALLRSSIDRGDRGDLVVARVGTLTAAVEFLKTRTPTVILADLALPDASWSQIVSQLSICAADSPLVVQSDVDDDEQRRKALAMGAQDYLVKKAITEAGLFRALSNALTRHRLQARLASAETRLDRANQELDDVAAVFAHDLRAPVRMARLLGEAMVTIAPDDDGRLNDCRLGLEDALGRVDRLILAMVEYEALRAPPTLGPVSVADAVDQALERLGRSRVLHGCEVNVDLPDDLFVGADLSLLTRVVSEIVDNALAFRRPDVVPSVSIGAYRSNDDHVTLRIVDNGKGIAEAERDRVFRAMDKLDPDVASGLGMGLPISRRIIESFGGSVEIASSPEPGTELVVKLPVMPETGSGPSGEHQVPVQGG